jgi:AGZA family xanthine/uracil permease-like MFS transporter
VILNPLILGGFSADQAAVDVAGDWLPNAQVAAATALTAGVMTILFGVIARLPFGFAAGLGINSFLAVSVVGQVTWAEAMGLVVINGLIIVLLASTGLRAMIFNAVPHQLKIAITVGIGLFIAFIGLVDAGFVRSSGLAAPPVQLGDNGSIVTLPTTVFVIGLILTGILLARKVKAALLIGIVSTTIIAVILEAIFRVGPSLGTNPAGWNLNAPVLPDHRRSPRLRPARTGQLRRVRTDRRTRGRHARLHPGLHELLRRHGHDDRPRQRGWVVG